MKSGLVEPGATVSLAGWTKPLAEPEVAVHIGEDLAGDADEATVVAAISGLSTAIELADLTTPPDDIGTILGNNIFQRHVVLGPIDRARKGGSCAGLATRVMRNGKEAASQAEIEANTGKLVPIVRHVASVLAACGKGLKAGEFIIAGSITAPFFLEADDRELVHHVDGLGEVSVRFG
jgi:2-keto-4-pentenoate hydratase